MEDNDKADFQFIQKVELIKDAVHAKQRYKNIFAQKILLNQMQSKAINVFKEEIQALHRLTSYFIKIIFLCQT